MTEDARLSHWLASQRAAIADGAPDAHVDVDTLARHATGQLSAAKASAVSEHLLVCDDGRCLAFVRAQAADVDAAADLLYPPPEEGAARPRTFQCKDVLWSMFEAAAEDTQLPIDELVNEAMVAYARTRGYWEGPTERRREAEAALEVTQDARSADSFTLRRPAAGAPPPEDLDESEPSRRRPPSLSPVTMRTPAHTPEAVPRAPASMPLSAARMPARAAAVPPPPASRRGLPPAPPAPARGMVPPPSSRRAPPPLPSAPPAPAAPMMGTLSLAKRLVLTHEGRSVEVDKEHFIIGRSKGQADLRIDDPNVSRQHAAIERIGSIYYLVDLGSTNGVYVGDDRVTRRALVDGDVIAITSHRITCSLG